MEMVVALVHPDHRLMFELLAATGVRRSELLALQGRHLALDGERPHVKVRQRVRRLRKTDADGNARARAGLVVGPLKSQHSRRDLPIPLSLADRIAALGTAADEYVFHTDQARCSTRTTSPSRAVSCVRGGRGGVGRVPYVPAHGGVAPVRGGPKRSAGAAVARTPLAELHDRHLCPPARWRRGEPLGALRVNTGSTGCPETTANEARARTPEMVA